MTERLLQYIWQFQYFNRGDLETTNGEPLEILSQGSLNTNQGPDFHNAKIKVGNTILAGTIELHCKASEWSSHHHHNDDNYRNVILHVVLENDAILQNNIPVLELSARISRVMLKQYDRLMQSDSFLACSGSVQHVKDLTWVAWKERLLAERLTRKAVLVHEILKQTNTHWEETFWILLARSFGTKVNSEAFEAIARSISINTLAKHKASIHQLEALLLGQANLLTGSFEDEYPKLLQREYRFLSGKYNLRPINFPVHFLRMRPANFPTIRLAQLAALIHQSSHLFSKILETDKLDEVKKWLQCTANDFWHYHYQFETASGFKIKRLGSITTSSIIINTIVPTLFAYGLYHRNEKHTRKALHWLEQLQSENNSILSGFSNHSVIAKTAYDSQALIELRNEYCIKKRCLECSVGNSILRN